MKQGPMQKVSTLLEWLWCEYLQKLSILMGQLYHARVDMTLRLQSDMRLKTVAQQQLGKHSYTICKLCVDQVCKAYWEMNG